MKLRTFIILVVISLILGVMAYRVVDVNPPVSQHSRLGQQPFADYPLDRTATIKVMHAAGSVILEKEGLTWVVADRFRYPADFEKIADLVQKLTASRVGDAFEVFPDTLDRLHLHDPAAPDIAADRKGLRVVFQDERRQPLLDVILGRSRAGAAGGHYVLAEDHGGGFLVDSDFRPFSRQAALDWTDKRLLDVRPEAIEKVVCQEPGGGRVLYTLKRPAPDHEPVWVEAKPQDSVQDHRIDAVFRALINLSMEDVVGRADAPDEPLRDHAGPQLVYYLYDGTIYTVHPGAPLTGGDRISLRLSAAYAPPPERSPEFSDRFPETQDPDEQRDRASNLNNRLAAWVYAVQAWRHGNFIVDPAVFVAPAE